MRKCEGCDAENDDQKNFCRQCGRLLPDHRKPAFAVTDIGGDFHKAADALFSGLGPGKPARPAPASTETRTGRSVGGPGVASDASGGRAATLTRVEALRSIAKAASRALARSIALSLAVLGPGFLMLLAGYQIAGMAWLFAGSFALMAWTYRKPWRLGWISCLAPPLAAAACYGLQLFLFGSKSPPQLLLLAAIGAGVAVGYVRAQSHKVARAGDGGIVAERTIRYLLVWVLAYGATQALGLVAANAHAVRAGLVTGAFSTAMLAVVSGLIWMRFRQLKASEALPIIAAICLLFAGIVSTEPAHADSAMKDRFERRLGGSKAAPRSMQILLPPGLTYRNVGISTRKTGNLDGAWAVYKFYRDADALTVVVTVESYAAVSGTAEAEHERLLADYRKYNYHVGTGVVFLDNGGGQFNIRDVRIAGLNVKLSGVFKGRLLRAEASMGGLPNSVSSILPGLAMAAIKLAAEAGEVGETGAQNTIVPPPPSPVAPPQDRAGGYCWSTISDGYVGPEPGLSEDNPRCLFVLSCQEALRIGAAGGQFDFRDKRDSSTSTANLEMGVCAAAPATGGVSAEQAAAVGTAVATILVAAGVAVNVAQAIAVSIANALQSGVQLTAEEIQQAVSDALLLRGTGAEEEANAPSANAPPNVQVSERVRPPTPVLDENGKPLETNEDGQYWGPDGTGTWRWLSRAEAQEAAAALHAGRNARATEQGQFESAAQQERDAWWEEKQRESRQADAQRQAAEAEQAARDARAALRATNLNTSILNALKEMPPGQRRSEAMAALQRTANKEELEALWNGLRGEREAQLDRLRRETNALVTDSDRKQRWEDGATGVRDASKVVLGAGLGVASGGGASIAQAVATVVVGGSGVTTISAIEQGITAKDGQEVFDGWEATKGAVRGMTSVGGSLVGGMPANGSGLIAAAKTAFAATSTGATTYADTYEKTGSREIAANRGALSGFAAGLNAAGGEAFDEFGRRTTAAHNAAKSELTPEWSKIGAPTQASRLDAIHTQSQNLIDAGKKTAGVATNTLVNIASSDEDLTTSDAAGKAVRSEFETWAAGKAVGAADAGGQSTPSDAQQKVLDRWQAERAGNMPDPGITESYDQYLSGRNPRADSTLNRGDRSDFVQAPSTPGDTGGFTTAAQRHAQMEADSMGVKFTARRVSPGVAADMEAGHILPKPPGVKANTGKDIDIKLGMDPAHIDRAVIFDARLPPRGNESDAEWAALETQQKMRAEQATAYREKMTNSEQFAMRGQLIVDRETGKPFGGDMDGMAVTGLHGEPLPRAVSEEYMRRVIRNPKLLGQDILSQVEHPEHLAWDIASLDNTARGADGKTEYERALEINERILAKIRPGGETLATFTGRSGMAPPKVGSTYYTGPGPKTERDGDA